jgi:transaldolase
MAARVSNFKIKLFADGANLNDMIAVYREGIVDGFTTNPTLMRKAGVTDYLEFAKAAVKAIPDLPISFEVFADDLGGMKREARRISEFGENVYVKIPITNTKRESTMPVVKELSEDGLKLNVTAILTREQVNVVSRYLSPKTPGIVSVFAGRIADTGVDPVPIMTYTVGAMSHNANAEVLWASSRELLNLVQAESCGCHIITITNDILKKIPQLGKDHDELSLDTVRMFFNDANSAGYVILP